MTEIKADQNNEESFSFTSDHFDQAQKIIARYPSGWQASAVMPLLDLAQRQNNGHLSQTAMDYIAAMLDMPNIRVYEVATFYTMYNHSPIGENHVQVCTNLPCWLRGSDEIINTCKNFLGLEINESSMDGLFTLSEVECLGACVNAPMLQINDDYYEDLNPDTTVEILSQIKMGKKPKPGSQIRRYSCEPITGLTCLEGQRELRKEKVGDN